MATPIKPTTTTGSTATTTPAATPRPLSTSKYGATKKPEQTFLFDRQNYIWMAGGLLLLFLGFLLMSGGKASNPNEFNYEEIYSFRRITLAPVILLLGFAVEAYAIMKKPKETAETAE